MSLHVADHDTDRWFLRPALVAVAGVFAVAVAIALNFLLPQDAEDVLDTSNPPPAPSLPATTTYKPDVAASESLPGFDVVRINPSGDTVIAGRAEPGATVLLRDGGQLLGQVAADNRGEWVFVPEAPLPSGAHRLELEMRSGEGTVRHSTEDVLIVVPKRGEDVAGNPASAGAQPLALRIPRRGGPAMVMQKPDAAGGETALAIDSIDYDELGYVALGGHAPASSRVRLRIDRETIGEAIADADGRWRITPSRSISSELHTLTVEQLDAAGKAVARTAVPLALGELAGRSIEGQHVVVQRGQNLWRLARSAYGRGTLYTVIFAANRGRIDNPHLIYPGQVFRLPGSPGEVADD
ncbi:MAG: LysM peptidoglycan-binding domain-containing protein [Bacteroidota bacterium]